MPTQTRSTVDTDGAAAILSVSPGTLRNWLHRGEGPPYVKLGRRVVYRVADLEAYVVANRVEPKAAHPRVGRRRA